MSKKLYVNVILSKNGGEGESSMNFEAFDLEFNYGYLIIRILEDEFITRTVRIPTSEVSYLHVYS